ncbi:hypothetical protein GUJ93_ZPchr0001g32747 [Zizania palustris]|uniref:Uncharacterized protein n=1 Tax=Zizania palustris TaxID=103762 RepID=A0A8J5RWB2_ZIZPA|nr:hypothetical protein GUJ93_ZPchr0001g32747 [Zizania palustris]
MEAITMSLSSVSWHQLDAASISEDMSLQDGLLFSDSLKPVFLDFLMRFQERKMMMCLILGSQSVVCRSVHVNHKILSLVW